MASKFTVSTVFAAIDNMSTPLQKMNLGVERLGEGVTKAKKKISESMGATGAIMGGVAAAATSMAIAAGAAMYKLAVDVSTAGDEIAKTARYLGMTSDSLQEFRYMGELSGVAISEMDNALMKLTVNLGKGTKEVDDSLSLMGLTVEQLKAAGPDEVMNLLADGMQRVKDPTDRARIAVALFGRSGVKMVNVLSSGRDGMAQMAQEAHSLGYVMDSELLTASEQLNDDILRMKTTFKAVGNTMAAQFIPIVDRAVNKITEMSKAGRTGFASAFTGIADVVGELFIQILPVLDSVFQVLAPVLTLITTLLKGLSPVFVMVGNIIQRLAPTIGLLAELLAVLLGPALEMAAYMIEPMVEMLAVLLWALTPIIKVVLIVAKTIMNAFNSLPGPVKGAIMILLGVMNPIMGFPLVIAGAWQILKTIIPSVIDGIIIAASFLGDFFKGLWTGIVDTFDKAINFIMVLLEPLFSVLDVAAKGLEFLGIDLGGKKESRPISTQTQGMRGGQTSRSELQVNFNNAPAGTTTKQTGSAPGINVNMGYAAAYIGGR